MLIGFAGLGALLAISAAYLIYVDHGYLRPEVERRLTKVLNRQVSIDGDMHLRIGGTTRISVDDLHVASDSWSKLPYLAEVGRIRLTIDTASLLAGPVEIESLAVEDARVVLERRPDGRVNWVLGQPGEVLDRPPGELPVVVRKTAFKDSRVEFDTPGLEKTLVIAIESLEQSIDEGGIMRTRLSGAINATPLTYEDRLDNLPALFDRSNVSAEFDASLGEIELKGRIVIDDLWQPHRPLVDVRMAGPDYAYLAEVLKLKVRGNGPLAARAQLAPDGERMRFDIASRIGKFHLEAAGHVDDLRTPRVVEARIDSSGPNLANVARVFDVHGVPAKPFALTGHVGNDGDRIVLRDARAQLGEIDVRASGSVRPGARPGVDLAFESDDFDLGEYVPDPPAGPLALRVTLAPDGEKSKFDVDGRLGDLRLKAAGSLDDLESPQDIGADVDAAGPDLAAAARLFGADLPAGPFNVAGHVGWQGGQFVFRDTRMQLGKVSVVASGGIRPDERPSIDLALDSDHFDLGEYVPDPPAGPLTLRVTLAPDGEKSRFDVDGTLAALRLKALGTLDDLDSPQHIDAEVDGAGPDLAAAARLFGIDGLPAGPFALAGYVGWRDGQIVFRDTAVRLGKVNLRGSGSVRAAARPTIDVTVRSEQLDLSGYLPQVPAAPADARIRLSPDGQTVRFDVEGSFAELKLKSAGSLDDLAAPHDIDADVDITGPSLARAARLFGIENAPARPFTVAGQLRKEAGRIAFRAARASVGELRVHGSGSVLAGEIPRVVLNLEADTLDLTPYLPPAPNASAPTATGKNRRGRLLADEALPFDALQDLDVRLDAVAKQVIAGPRSLSDISLKAGISDGVLTIPEFYLVDKRGGQFRGAFVMQPDGAGGHVGLRVDGRGLDLGLPAANQAEQEALPHYDVHVLLDATGSTVRQLAASANGYFQIKSGKGRLRTRNMRLFTNDFLAELLGTIDPFLEDDPYTNVQCAVVAAVVENGEVSGEPGLVVQSDRLLIAARARIDLRNEILDADINTVPRKGLGVSVSSFINPYIKVGGTLADPHFEIDPKSFLEGGAAIMTGGISIVAKSMFDRVTASADPCGDAADAAGPAIRRIEEQYGGELSTE